MSQAEDGRIGKSGCIAGRHDGPVLARFFTADLHLGHRNIARYEPDRARAAGVAPLDGPADDETQSRLDSFLIDRWSEVVGPDDEVWLLGDSCMGRLDRTLAQLRRLLGRIVLVPGNHDRVWAGDHRREQWWDRYLNAGVDEIVDGTTSLELGDGIVVDVATSRTRATRELRTATSTGVRSTEGASSYTGTSTPRGVRTDG